MYGGTKEEMQRLIADAAKLDKSVDANSMSFGNVVKAIHAVQTEMGITGTTSKEAATTIEGSLNMVKGAWQNVLTDMSRGGETLDGSINNLVESVGLLAKNVIPVMTQALTGAGSLVTELAPIIVEQLPILAETVLPSLLESAFSLVDSLLTGLLEAAPSLIETAQTVLSMLLNWAVENAPIILGVGISTLLTLTQGIAEAIPELVARLPEIITAFINYFTENLPTFLGQGFTILETLMFGLLEAIPTFVEHMPEIIDALVNFFVENFPLIISMGAELIGKLIVGIIGAIPEILSNLPKVVSSIVNGIGKAKSELRQTGKHLLEGLWNGINDKVAWLKGKVHGVVDKIKGWFTSKDGFDEHSPSKWSKQVGAYVDEGLGGGIEDGLPEIMRQTKKVTDNVKSGFNDINAVSVGYDASSNGSYGGYGSKTVNYGGVNISVNASDYTSGRQFAEEVAERLAEMAEEERRAYA